MHPIFLVCLLLSSMSLNGQTKIILQEQKLELEKVAEGAYIHRSFLQTDDFGAVACNGLIVYNQGEAIMLDTPTNPEATDLLITWIEDSLNCKLKSVVATHFHMDCLGGLDEVHRRRIPSYALKSTIALAEKNKFPVPQNGFSGTKSLPIGKIPVNLSYFGLGHTSDNIVAYVPDLRILFGGCLIKELDASEGYLGDADPAEWPNTVSKIRNAYPVVKFVVPGHGKYGDKTLLDYTIRLFSTSSGT